MNKLNSKQLRKSDPTEEEIKTIKRNPIYLVFRLADAIAAEKVYLCGEMEYPPSSRIHKAAVGTENWVPWTTRSSAALAVRELKNIGVQVIAVEQDKRAISYKDLKPVEKSLGFARDDKKGFTFPLAIIAGNETEGLPKEVLNEVDIIVELPMFGINRSFNVWGSTAVIAYKILENL